MSDHPRGTDKLMTNLKVISRVNQHEKISTTAEQVRIDGTPSWMQTIRRWYNGESRDANLNTITTVIDNAFSQLDLYIQKSNPTASEKIFVLALQQDLAKTVDGLTNLKTTYTDDSVVQARIDLLIQRINTYLDMDKISAYKNSKNSDSSDDE